METPQAVQHLSPKAKLWIAIASVIVLVAFGSLFYGMTQRSIEKEHERTELMVQQFNQQIADQKTTNETLQMQVQQQMAQTQLMQQKYDLLQASSLRKDTSKSGVTIVKEYDPTTGALIREMSNKIEELDKSISESKTETHSEATSTVAVTTTASSTVTAAATSTESHVETTAATTTVAITEKDKVVIKPADGKNSRDMRFTIGAAYHDTKVKPVAGYTVKAFGIGKVISLGPGILVGDDLLGGAVQADLFHLPRVGAGYGCSFKGKDCGPLFTLGIRLDF